MILSACRHLPVNLVASFAKRLARLALWIPQHDQCLIITFFHNLIIRHPTMQGMVDRPQTGSPSSSLEDTYLPDERDPNKSNAIESSLWEIEVGQLANDRFSTTSHAVLRLSHIIIIRMWPPVLWPWYLCERRPMNGTYITSWRLTTMRYVRRLVTQARALCGAFVNCYFLDVSS